MLIVVHSFIHIIHRLSNTQKDCYVGNMWKNMWTYVGEIKKNIKTNVELLQINKTLRGF